LREELRRLNSGTNRTLTETSFTTETLGSSQSKSVLFWSLIFSVPRCPCSEINFAVVPSRLARNLLPYPRRCCQMEFQQHKSERHFPRSAVAPAFPRAPATIPAARQTDRGLACGRRKFQGA